MEKYESTTNLADKNKHKSIKDIIYYYNITPKEKLSDAENILSRILMYGNFEDELDVDLQYMNEILNEFIRVYIHDESFFREKLELIRKAQQLHKGNHS